MKRNRRPQPQPGTFTTSQIRDAYAAARISEEASAHAQSPEATIRNLFDGWDDTGDFVKAKIAQYQRGAALLERAMLVVSAAAEPDSREAVDARAGLTAASGGQTIRVWADDERVRYVGLTPKAPEPAQVRDLRTAYAAPA